MKNNHNIPQPLGTILGKTERRKENCIFEKIKN